MNTALVIVYIVIQLIMMVIGIVIAVWFWKNVIRLIKRIIEKI